MTLRSQAPEACASASSATSAVKESRGSNSQYTRGHGAASAETALPDWWLATGLIYSPRLHPGGDPVAARRGCACRRSLIVAVAIVDLVLGLGTVYLCVWPRAAVRGAIDARHAPPAETWPTKAPATRSAPCSPRARTPSVEAVVENLRKAKVDSRISAVLIVAERVPDGLLGQAAGGPRRHHRLPAVGQAGLRPPRVRRRSRSTSWPPRATGSSSCRRARST